MRTHNRRGMLLLIVLALLAMFAMLAVAFVVMTGSERGSAEKLKTIESQLEPPSKTLGLAAMVVARGTSVDPSMQVAPASAITWQNLMEHIYGGETIGTLKNPCALRYADITAVCAPPNVPLSGANGQLLEIPSPQYNPGVDVYGPNGPNTLVDPFRCVGCVLTMLDGPAAGMSTRIVGVNPQVNPQTGTYDWQVCAFEGGVLPVTQNNNPAHYIINGFPYSGMGFGFSNTGGTLTPTALLPNSPPSAWVLTHSATTNGIIFGGVNTDHTAADYQDPIVGLAAPDGNGGVVVPIPSMHRSELIQYWMLATGGGTNPQPLTVDQMRLVSFRPIGLSYSSSNNYTFGNGTSGIMTPVLSGTPDHPNFTGSNPNFNPIWDGVTNPYDPINNPNGPKWDVDNMGTGRPDSVWVDLGFPVRFTADGRAYKPLFAILCLDMDGRLNLNAHGSLTQSNSSYYQPQNVQSYTAAAATVGPGGYPLDTGVVTATGGPAYFAGPVSQHVSLPPVPLPRGQGTGPAEVNLWPLFRSGTASFTNYKLLLSGGTVGSFASGGLLVVTGRYGGIGVGIGSAMPGIDGTGSYLTLNNAFPYSGVLGGNYWATSGGTLDAYGTPPDFQTMGAIGLDTAGRTINISAGGGVINGPYDSDLTRDAAHAVDVAPIDNAFGVVEMERILRLSDRDATTLPRRLINLTLSDTTNLSSPSLLNARRAEFTVESNMVPVSAAVLPPALRQYLPNKRSVHPVDLIYAQVTKNMNLSITPTAGQMAPILSQLVPWEMMEGLKMDVNRPFGAGVFSLLPSYQETSQGGTQTLPDQPGTTGERVPQYVTSGSAATAAFNYAADAGVFSKTVVSGTPAPVNDSLAARQLYARHLYVLALSLADVDAIRQNWFSGDDESMKRMFAQWAVNVVAYRDHNNIMIPFTYDVYPFGNPATGKSPGWAPDPTSLQQHTVWGCKRPSLLLMETLAFHDRRTQDLPDETVDSTKPGRTGNMKAGTTHDTGDMKDPSFNSGFRPQGSLFVELFNPWPMTEPQLPDLATPVYGPGVDVTKVTPASSSLGASPIWRLIIVDPSKQSATVLHPNNKKDELPDPDSPTIAGRPTIERIVYFVSSAAAQNPPNDSNSQVYTVSVRNSHPLVVAPGKYAVVGSGDPNQANQTYIGFEVGQTKGLPATSRMVDLKGGAVVTVVKNAGASAPSAAPVPVLAIDSPRRLSISEPTRGYTKYESMGPKPATPDPITGKYDSTLDIPTDQQRDLSGDEKGIWDIINSDATQGAYRIIYLQRLADPTRPYVSDTNSNPQLWNPYRTIDAMTVDLTCFNGMTQDKDPTLAAGKGLHFESRQRGEQNWSPQASANEMNVWKQEPASKGNSLPKNGWRDTDWFDKVHPGTPATNMNFSAPLIQSLGYLNLPFNAPVGTAPSTPPGDPQYPFPLLNWAYRPFNNVYELLLVPTVSSSRLLARFYLQPNQVPNTQPYLRENYGYVDGAVRNTGLTPYDGSTPDKVPYPHLLNFFESQKSSAYGVQGSAQLHRLFYYLGVPSRFANTQIQVQAYNAGLNSWTSPAQQGPPHFFHTPFNHISRYREPGMINLNTVTSSDVLFGAMGMYPLLWQPRQDVSYSQIPQPSLNPVFWDKFVRSRRGDAQGTLAVASTTAYPIQQSLTNMFAISGAAPSRFMRPYRTPGGAALSAAEPPREADITLLRSDPDVAARSLYGVDDYLVNTTSSNIGGTPDNFGADVAAYQPSGLASMDFNRSPNFRYQLLEKLGSTVSNHSNVFAIWITVGYFEVTPAPTQSNGQPMVDPNGNKIYPDGYQLGQELGADTGDVTRHRAFYIFDRSLPVGYIRGQDVNTSKAFLLQRYIE